MEINESMKGLFKQFCKAYGIKKVDKNDKVLVQAFFDWLYEERRVQDNFYRELLNKLGLDIDNERVMEVGKTINDSIVLPYKTKIATPNGEGFENYKDRVTVANLKFYGSFPALVQKQGSMTHAIPVDLVNTFITQNPYSGVETKNWENFPYQDIIVGVYGDINDADRKNKMRQMNELFNRLNPESLPQKEHVVDDYYYATIITTNRKTR